MNAVAGFRKKEENDYRAQASHTRLIMWAALVPHQKKGADFTPEKLLTFPWEKPAQDALPERMPEELAAAALEMQARWDAVDAQLAKAAPVAQKLTLAQLLHENP